MYYRLVAVIGPSGSGKDALIAGAGKMLANNPAYYFTPGEITRPSSTTGERHVFVSEEEFRQRHGSGQYAISWSAHNTLYGINKTVEDRLAEGKMVVFNGSRAAIKNIRKKFSGVKVIFINAPEDVLADRLAARGRESEPQVKQRMIRNGQLKMIPDGAIKISNTGTLQQTLDEFVGALQKNSADES